MNYQLAALRRLQRSLEHHSKDMKDKEPLTQYTEGFNKGMASGFDLAAKWLREELDEIFQEEGE